jgi:hypothetical protein
MKLPPLEKKGRGGFNFPFVLVLELEFPGLYSGYNPLLSRRRAGMDL